MTDRLVNDFVGCFYLPSGGAVFNTDSGIFSKDRIGENGRE